MLAVGDEPSFAPLTRKLPHARDQLREDVTAAILNTVPSARAASSDELAAGVAQVVGGLVKVLKGEPLSPTDRSQLRDAGRHLSAMGMDSRAQATAVLLASQFIHRFMLAAADKHRFARNKDRKAAVVEMGDAMLNAVSVVQQAVVVEVRIGDGPRPAADTLVDRVLGAAPARWPEVEAGAAQAGLSGLIGLVIVLPPAGGPEDGAKLAARLVEQHHGKAGSLQPDPIPHVVVVFAVADAASWRLAVKHVSVEAGDAGCGVVPAATAVPIRKLPFTYALCRNALPFTSVLPSRWPAFDFAELQLFALLSELDPVHRCELFDDIVGALLEKPELFHLLDALVAIGPYDEVEEALGKPYRSITHSVTVIRKLTGHDWNDPRGRYLLVFATHLRWLAALSLGSFDETAWGPIPQFSILGGAR